MFELEESEMIKTLKLTSALFAGSLLAAGVYAEPISLTDAQMDTVAGGAFVCPVITTAAVLNSPKGGTLVAGEYYTIGATAPGSLTVPVQATNGGGDGSSPGPEGNFHHPGETSYTAIWF